MTAYTLFGQATGGANNAGGTNYVAGAAASLSIGCEFEVSSTVVLTGIWWYSNSTSVALPTACVIYNLDTASQVAGSLNSSPSWSGAAASGWVKCTYAGTPSLVSGTHYQVVVYGNSSLGVWWGGTPGVFSTSGITNGPLSAPSNASSLAGQNMVQAGQPSVGQPNVTENGKAYFVDVEVTTGGGAPVVVPPFLAPMRLT